jgi:hypothetical protein
MADKEVPVTEAGKTGPNAMRTETGPNAMRTETGPNTMHTETSQNSICANVVDENVSNDIAPKQWVTYHSTPTIQSSPKKQVVGLQKSTHLLSHCTCDPV